VLRAQSRYKEAIPAFEMARAINPAWPHVYGFLSDCKLWTGSVADAIPPVEQAIRINPRDAWVATWYSKIGRLHLVQSRTNKAIVWLEKARRANPQLPSVHAMLAAAYALNGEIDHATSELAEARGLSPRRALFKHVSVEGNRIFRRAEGLRHARNHLFRRPAQGPNAGGITARVS
jgi:tetratricopeptide (TPR) repeat protein